MVLQDRVLTAVESWTNLTGRSALSSSVPTNKAIKPRTSPPSCRITCGNILGGSSVWSHPSLLCHTATKSLLALLHLPASPCSLIVSGHTRPGGPSATPLLAHPFAPTTQSTSLAQQRALKAHCLSQAKLILSIQRWGELQLPELSCKLIILQRSFRQSQRASNYRFSTLYNFLAKCNTSLLVSHHHLSLRTTWEQ